MTEFLRRTSAMGIFVLLFSLLAFLVLKVFPPVGALEIKRAAREFAQAWQSDKLDSVTYDPSSGADVNGGDPGLIKQNTHWMTDSISGEDANRPLSVVTVGDPRTAMDGTAVQTLAVTWQLDAGRQWTYDTEVTMKNSGNRWRVLWRPSTVHPYLQHGLILAGQRLRAERAPIQDFSNTVLAASGAPAHAAQLIGNVQTATIELAELDPGRIVAGDKVGVSGLEQLYDARLAGGGGVEVDVVRDPRYTPLQPLVRQAHVSPPTPGKPVVLTLDQNLQSVAEQTLSTAGVSTPAALVLVDVAHGAVLADANIGNDPQGYAREKGLQGQYAPGAVFRLPTMLALIRHAGVTPQTQTDCRNISYLGQQFVNPPNTPTGSAELFSSAFARNCVTGFVSAARSLTGVQIQQAAQTLGYQVHGALGAPSFEGLVPATTDPLELVQNAIGEGSVLASPLVVARASATVSNGSYHPSTLVTQPPQDQPPQNVGLSAAEQATLKQLMEASAQQDGAQQPLTALGNAQLGAISGTAAYGPSGAAAPASQNSWSTGFVGHVAFAVIVTGRPLDAAGVNPAATIAAAFLRSAHLA